MSVAIRLRREGSLNNPYYKIVVADQRSPRDGKFIDDHRKLRPEKSGAEFQDRPRPRRLLDQARRATIGHGAQHHQEGEEGRAARRVARTAATNLLPEPGYWSLPAGR